MVHRNPAFLVLLGLVAGCSAPSREAQVEKRLVDAGIKPKLADCLAPRLAANLSNDQLKALAKAAGSPEGGTGRKALMRRIGAIGDPQIADVVSGAALACATGG